MLMPRHLLCLALCIALVHCSIHSESSQSSRTLVSRSSLSSHPQVLTKRVNTDPIPGATLTNLTLSKGSLSAWISNGPKPAEVGAVVISTHGVEGNARDYYNDMNAAYFAAKGAGLARTHVKTLRMAPYFFDIDDADMRINGDTLGWSEQRWWCEGRGSSHPSGSSMTPFKIWDELIAKFSDVSKYPNLKYITFVGHGCGGITTQLYSVVSAIPVRAGIQLRFVIGNPSTEVYFTSDRPTTFDPLTCPVWEDWPMSLKRFDVGYPHPGPAPKVFKRYIARDVRYLVGLADLGGGDQSCQAQALGGVARKDRTLAYWKYLHLLSGDGDPANFTSFPGNFTNLSSADHQAFKGGKVNHQLFQFPTTGHEPGKIINSAQGQNAIWGE